MLKKNLFFISLIFIILSCSTVNVVPLELERVDNKGNKIKLDGFYFQDYKNDLDETYAYSFIFFYKNGVFLSKLIYGNDFSNLLSFLSNDGLIHGVENDAGPPNVYRLPFHWGIYQINDIEIIFERWISTPGWRPYETTTGKMKILDMNTLLIQNDTLKYYHYKSKPDSVSCFFPRLLSRKECKNLSRALEKGN